MHIFILFGITVTITIRRLVTYTTVCPSSCNANATTTSTYEYVTKSAAVVNTEGEIVSGIPSPMGFNPISIPHTIGSALYDAFLTTIMSQIIDGARATQFNGSTQQKINNIITNVLRTSTGWSSPTVDFGACE